MSHEQFIFRALRQQHFWPSIHAAVEVYQRRRSSAADHYELIWRLIHVCECTVITLAAAAVCRLREMGKGQEYLKLRERCYGITWSSTEETLEKSQGALDGSIDKWIEILQYVGTFSVDGSAFLEALRTFLVGEGDKGDEVRTDHYVDLAPFVRAWNRACEAPPSVLPELVSVKDALLAINSFRNRFAHVPFPYDQLQEIYRELETCTFRIFEVPPTAANDASPLSGCFAVRDSLLRGAGYQNPPDTWQGVDCESFVWGKKGEQEVWDARPFVFLDKMMRPYLLNRLKNEAGSWEYIRYLAEANAVYSISEPDLLKVLPRPGEGDYRKEEPQLHDVALGTPALPSATRSPITNREEAFAAVRQRDFEPAIEFWKREVDEKPYYHSGWQRLGFAQREYGVDLADADVERAEQLLLDSIQSLTHAVNHSEPQFRAEAFYNRSKAHWRLWRLTDNRLEFENSLKDAQMAIKTSYDHRFLSWNEFLEENLPPVE